MLIYSLTIVQCMSDIASSLYHDQSSPKLAKKEQDVMKKVHDFIEFHYSKWCEIKTVNNASFVLEE